MTSTPGRPTSTTGVAALPVREGRPKTSLTWGEAHRVANMAAAKAHATLEVDLSGVSVDVVTAVGSAGLLVMWRSMPQLFGAYVNEPGSTPGVLINQGLPRPARRYTCGHELGHHWMRHASTVDDGSTIDTVAREEFDMAPPANRRRTWHDQEKLAEAFASWFLMPRRVVANALDVLNLDRPRGPVDVYQLSLLLGTSYRTTLRQLPNLRLGNAGTTATWAKVAPGRIKAQLDAGVSQPASRYGDVWAIDSRYAGLELPVSVGDRFVVRGMAADYQISHSLATEESSHLTSLGMASGALQTGAVYEITAASPGDQISVTFDDCAVNVRVHAGPTGLDPRGAG